MVLLERDEERCVARPLQIQLCEILAIHGDDGPKGGVIERCESPVSADACSRGQGFQTLPYPGFVTDLCWEELVDGLGDNFGWDTMGRWDGSARAICRYR